MSAVPDAATALDHIESHPRDEGTFALLLTDIVMPEMSGYELAEQAARRSPGIRIVFMTGYRDLPPPAGASILYKPFSLEALLTLVREHLGGDQDER